MSDRKVTAMYFDYNVTHRIVAEEAEVSLGETVYLEATFWERSHRFYLPTEKEDGATALLAIEHQGKLYEIKGEIRENKVTVTLTPNFIQLGSVLDCWFVWKVGDKVSPRFPLKLRVKYNPTGVEPPPEKPPAPVERFVTVADQETGKVSPPVIEARLEGIEKTAKGASGDAGNALEESGKAWALAETAAEAAGQAQTAAGLAQDTADNAMTEAQAALNLAKTKADAPVTELTSPDGTEKYTALGGVVTKSMAVPPEWRVLVNGNKLAEFPGIPPLPWNGQPQEGRYAASGVIPNWSIEIARGAGSGVIVSLYSFNATGSAYSARIEKDYWEFVSGSVPFVIYIGPQFPMGAEVVLFFNDLPPVNYPLMTQAQIDGLATKGYVDGLFADSADYNWKFIQGLGGTTISSASRMVYWPYTSPSSSTFQPWLYAPTVTYPKMDFRVWEGTGAHNVGKYFTIRCQLYADVIEKTTQTRMGKDLTLYLTPSGFKTTLPNLTADMFPSAGAVVEIQGVDFAVTLLSALGYDPSLFEADIGSLAWAANMSSGTGAVNPRIQFRRHRE